MLNGQVFQTRGSGPQPNVVMSFAAAQAHADIKDLIVRAVEFGFGTDGWGTTFKGAVDQVVFTGPVASVTANFEVTAPPPAPIKTPTAVPTMGVEGLLGMSAALGLAAWFRRRSRNRRS